ncbi:hypothetical protein ACHAQA_004311 [Verticillium albo-atrum]
MRTSISAALLLALSAQAAAQPLVNGLRPRGDSPKPTWSVVNVDGSNGDGGCAGECESATVTVTKEPAPTTVTHRVTDTVIRVSSKPVISVVPIQGKPDKAPVTVTVYESTETTSSTSTPPTPTSTSTSTTSTTSSTSSSSSLEPTTSTTLTPVAPVPQPEPTLSSSPSVSQPHSELAPELTPSALPAPEPESTTYTSVPSMAPAPPVWVPEPEQPSSSTPAWIPEPEPTTSLPVVWDPVPAPEPTVSAPPVWVPEPSPLSSSIEVSSALPSADASWPSEPVWSPVSSSISVEPTSWAPAPTTLVTLISSITEAAAPESTSQTPDDGLWHTTKYPPHTNGTASHFRK